MNCDDVQASKVNAALGTNFNNPETTENEAGVVCNYKSADESQYGVIRFATDVTDLASEKKGFDDNQQPTETVAGVGHEAFSSHLGSGDIASTTLVARKGTFEILITANVALDKEIALAKDLLG